MQRYFFNLTNGSMSRDDYGDPCDSLQDAKSHALHVAGELGRNKSDDEIRDLFVCVTDESGREVFRTPVVNVGSTVAIKGSMRCRR